MGWQADLECYDEPIKLPMFMPFMSSHMECPGHWKYPAGIEATRHSAEIYWKKEENVLSDDWGFLIPSLTDEVGEFESGKLVCNVCGCYVHRDKRETHREKCNFV